MRLREIVSEGAAGLFETDFYKFPEFFFVFDRGDITILAWFEVK